MWSVSGEVGSEALDGGDSCRLESASGLPGD